MYRSCSHRVLEQGDHVSASETHLQRPDYWSIDLPGAGHCEMSRRYDGGFEVVDLESQI